MGTQIKGLVCPTHGNKYNLQELLKKLSILNKLKDPLVYFFLKDLLISYKSLPDFPQKFPPDFLSLHANPAEVEHSSQLITTVGAINSTTSYSRKKKWFNLLFLLTNEL